MLKREDEEPTENIVIRTRLTYGDYMLFARFELKRRLGLLLYLPAAALCIMAVIQFIGRDFLWGALFAILTFAVTPLINYLLKSFVRTGVVSGGKYADRPVSVFNFREDGFSLSFEDSAKQGAEYSYNDLKTVYELPLHYILDTGAKAYIVPKGDILPEDRDIFAGLMAQHSILKQVRRVEL